MKTPGRGLTMLMCVSVMGGMAAGEGAPYLLKDINPATALQAGNSEPYGFTEIGGMVYFVATDPAHGRELWKTDGTGEGTEIVKDINPGENGSSQASFWIQDSFVSVNDKLFFVATDGSNGVELWKSDGTEEGTVMVQDLFPWQNDSYPSCVTNMNGTLYFFADDGTHGKELFKCEAPYTEIVLVKDIYPGANGYYAEELIVINNTLFFKADDGTHGGELWKSDGTGAGTIMVKDIYSGFDTSQPYLLTDVNGTLFFAAIDSAHGRELWKSDGTEAGTVLVKDIKPGSGGSSCAFSMANINGTAYLTANDGTNGNELWKSDGTEEGTVMVKDIYSGSGGSYPGGFLNLNGSVVFQAFDGYHGTEIWKSDGTEDGTVLVKDINPGSGDGGGHGMMVMNGALYVPAEDGTHGVELWKSDGTADGTVLVKDVYPGVNASVFYEPADINGTLFFQADDGTNGIELWISDGTEAGTVMVKNIHPEITDSNIEDTVTLNGTMFFPADDGSGDPQLWKSDGTEAGTVMVKNINPGSGSGVTPEELTVSNGLVFFIADDGITGKELWGSDGSETGTVLIKDIYPGANSSWPGKLTDVNGTLFFAASDGTNGNELWKSNGTEPGTVLVKDIMTGSNGSSPSYLVNLNGTLFFSANDPACWNELWKSDGTEAGTVVVKDIWPGALDGSYPSNLTDVNGVLFFSADNGTHGNELWKSDGTVGGTTLAVDINPGIGYSYPYALTPVGQTLLFTADDGTNGRELWECQSPYVTASMVKDLTTGSLGSDLLEMTNMNGTLFFVFDDGVHGKELWKSDGNEINTIMVADLLPGVAGSEPGNLTVINDLLFFAANDGVHGRELWSSQGTEASTSRVSDISPGLSGSNPEQMTLLNGKVLFVAHDDTATGSELYALPLTPLPPSSPGTKDVTEYSITWTWEDNSTQEDGFNVYVDMGTDPPSSLLGSTDPDVEEWPQASLNINSPYIFQVAAFNDWGESERTENFTAWTLIEPVSGLNLEPFTDHILVQATNTFSNLAEGDSAVYYENQTRGVNGGWRKTLVWNNAGLDPNTQYTFIGKSHNGESVETLPCEPVSIYTLANTPAAPFISDITANSTNIAIGEGDGNPAWTEYAIKLDVDAWVLDDGTTGPVAFFQTAAEWGTTTVTGLAECTDYIFRAMAKNGDGVLTEFSLEGTASTPDVTPPHIDECPPEPEPLVLGSPCSAALPDLRGEVIASDTCSETTVTQDPLPGTPIASDTFVTLTVADGAGNHNGCGVNVSVVDSTNPVAVCRDATLEITEGRQAILAPETIDGGSSDNCLILDGLVTPDVFTCDQLGPHTVTLQIVDYYGNSDECTATVTVVDAGGCNEEGEGGPEGEGEGAVEGEGETEVECPAESLLGHPYGISPGFSQLPGSDASMGECMYDDFSGVSGAIHRVIWFGTNINLMSQFCERNPDPFTITFYQPGSTPGALLNQYSIFPARTDTGVIFHEDPFGPYPVLRYEAVLDPPYTITEGWVAIQAVGDGSCFFGWLPGTGGNGTSYASGFLTQSINYDLGFCFVGGSEGEGTLEGEAEGSAEGGSEGIVEGSAEGGSEGVVEGEGSPEGGEDGFLNVDQDKNNLISLSELLRVIQFFNSNGFHCEAGTEDGYAPGPGDTSCAPYNSDYNTQDWHISLSELLRVIQFFNSGGYHYCPGETTEDGFCPGLA